MIKASIYFVLTAAVLLAVFVFGFNGTFATAALVGSVFLVLLNMISFAYVSNAFDQRPGIVIRRFMASMTVKLLVSIGLLAWYMMQPEKDKGIAVFLVILYFILLMLNSAMAMGKLKNNWNEGAE